MEAHGTINTIPVGHIRGVCDYADKDKNWDWQGFAAATAAVYAREVLCSIHPRSNVKGKLVGSSSRLQLNPFHSLRVKFGLHLYLLVRHTLGL